MFQKIKNELESLSEDYEVKILLLWAIVSPLASMSFLIWNKYPNLRWLSGLLFLFAFIHFIGSAGGFVWVVSRLIS